jgi:hypothetical protein
MARFGPTRAWGNDPTLPRLQWDSGVARKFHALNPLVAQPAYAEGATFGFQADETLPVPSAVTESLMTIGISEAAIESWMKGKPETWARPILCRHLLVRLVRTQR